MKQAFPILVLLLYAACHHATEPRNAEPEDLISKSNVDKLNISFTDYDKIRITHQSGPSLRSREFKKVGMGILDSLGYQEISMSGSTYDPSADLFSFILDFSLSLDSTRTQTSVVLRYYGRDSSFTDVDTVILQYKYPYSGAQIYCTDSIMILRGYFQDIDFLANKLYFHPTGPEGLYEYNPSTNATRTLAQYGAGDHIAADSIFVFCDINHFTIQRYNLLTETIDLIVDTLTEVSGLETYQGFLYALEGRFPTRLLKYTYDGTLVDSGTFVGVGYHLTISDGIAYTFTFSNTIRRLDLVSMVDLPTVAAPARNLEGIRIVGGQLYFSDWYRRLIGSVPLKDLK